MYFTKSFIIIITISVELFILDFTHIMIDIYHILICSFSMSSLPRKLKQKPLKDCLNEKKSTGPRYPGIGSCWRSHSAEIYNKDGNKLDLYGKVDGLHYFSDDSSKDGDQSYVRLGFKGETQINDQLTGYGQWEYNVQANNTEGADNQSWTRLAFAGLKFANTVHSTNGRNYGVLYDVEAGPICCQSSAATPTPGR